MEKNIIKSARSFCLLLLVFAFSCERDEQFINSDIQVLSSLKVADTGLLTDTITYNKTSTTISAKFNSLVPWILTFTGDTSKYKFVVEGTSNEISYSWNGVIENVLQLDDENYTVTLSLRENLTSEVFDTVNVFVKNTPKISEIGGTAITFDNENVVSSIFTPNENQNFVPSTVGGETYLQYNFDISNDQFQAALTHRNRGISNGDTIIWKLISSEIDSRYGGKAYVGIFQKDILNSILDGNSNANAWWKRRATDGIVIANTNNTLDLSDFSYNNTYFNFYMYSDEINKYKYKLNYWEKNSVNNVWNERVETNFEVANWIGWKLVSVKLSDFPRYFAHINVNASPDGVIQLDNPVHRIDLFSELDENYSRLDNFNEKHIIAVDNFIITKNKPLQEILDDLY